MNNMLVPKLRFKDERGQDYPDWSIKYLQDIAVVSSSKRVHQKDWTSSGIPFYRAREIVALHAGKEISPLYISNTLYSKCIQIGGRIVPGDLLITGVGSIGVQYLVKENDKFYYKDGNIIQVHINTKNVNSEYLYHLFDSASIKAQILMLSGDGSTVKTYTITNAKKTKLPIPSLTEQEKIADFLSTYDCMIDVQSQRVEAMKTRKKGLLQKIFSQEIRFKDDQGQDYPKWEKTTVENLASNIIGGGTPSTKNASFYTGDIPWVSSSDLLENKINYLNVTRFITQNAIDNSATKLIPANSVMIVSRVGVGKVAINTLPLCTSQDFMNLVVKEGNSPTFIAYLLMNLMLRKKNSVQGTAIKGIPSTEIKKFNVLVPSIIEQQKIADFLTAVDAQIEVEEKRMETIKTIKNGLLQQMFI